MNRPDTDAVFAGSVPEVYERCLVPLIFEPYADDLVARVQARQVSSVLEVAAGTGVVTRALAAGLGDAVAITATDLNAAMLAHARSVGTSGAVEWREADVMHLPFADDAFDVVVCQYSVMFFPDRPRAYGEVARVLKPGGTFLFNVWDRIENNEFAATVAEAVGELFPEDPPLFLARTPHGYHDEGQVRADLVAGGFAGPITVEALEHRSRATTPDIPAVAYCQGTPLRDEIVARDASRLEEATIHAARRLAERYGAVDLDGLVRGFVVEAATC